MKHLLKISAAATVAVAQNVFTDCTDDDAELVLQYYEDENCQIAEEKTLNICAAKEAAADAAASAKECWAAKQGDAKLGIKFNCKDDATVEVEVTSGDDPCADAAAKADNALAGEQKVDVFKGLTESSCTVVEEDEVDATTGQKTGKKKRKGMRRKKGKPGKHQWGKGMAKPTAPTDQKCMVDFCNEENAVMILDEFEGDDCTVAKPGRSKYICDFRPNKDKKKPDCWKSKGADATEAGGFNMQCSADKSTVKMRHYKDEVCGTENTTELGDDGDTAEMDTAEVAVMTMGGCGKGRIVGKDGKAKGNMSMKKREGKGRKHHKMKQAGEEMGGDPIELIDPEQGVRKQKGGFGRPELDEMIKNCKGKGKGKGKKPAPKGKGNGKGSGSGSSESPADNPDTPNMAVGDFVGEPVFGPMTPEMTEMVDWEAKTATEQALGVDVFTWSAGDATSCVEEEIDTIVSDMVAKYTAGNTQEAEEVLSIQMDSPNTMPEGDSATTDYDSTIKNALSEAVEDLAGSSCFAGSANVEILNGYSPISSLKVGDLIRTASGFEPVVGFLHAEKGTTNFVELSTAAGVLPITPDHLVFLANGQAVPAANIKVGDSLASGVVTEINHVVRSDGIYSPITKSGTIIVEGNVASTYAAAHESLSHSLSHIMTAPLRWLGVYTSPATDRKVVSTVFQSTS